MECEVCNITEEDYPFEFENVDGTDLCEDCAEKWIEDNKETALSQETKRK